MRIAKGILEVIKVSIIFILCTILFFNAFRWISMEYQNYHRYEEPTGAIKVQKDVSEERTLIDRLIYFYENGE